MVRRCELDSSGSGKGAMVGSCEHGNESSGSIRAGDVPEGPVNYDIVALITYFIIYDLVSMN
jgi:hypothetical protein